MRSRSICPIAGAVSSFACSARGAVRPPRRACFMTSRRRQRRDARLRPLGYRSLPKTRKKTQNPRSAPDAEPIRTQIQMDVVVMVTVGIGVQHFVEIVASVLRDRVQ